MNHKYSNLQHNQERLRDDYERLRDDFDELKSKHDKLRQEHVALKDDLPVTRAACTSTMVIMMVILFGFSLVAHIIISIVTV